jgi:hypothetical protein
MSIKYTYIFHCKPLQNLPKWVFFGLKTKPSGIPASLFYISARDSEDVFQCIDDNRIFRTFVSLTLNRYGWLAKGGQVSLPEKGLLTLISLQKSSKMTFPQITFRKHFLSEATACARRCRSSRLTGSRARKE